MTSYDDRGGDVLVEAARTLLAEESGDLSPDDMRARLLEVVGDETRLDVALAALANDAETIRVAASAYLENVAERVGEERVRDRVDDAAEAMPVLETGVLAIAAMYMTWVLITKGKREEQESEETSTTREGITLTKREKKTTYWAPTGPLRTIVDLLKGHR